jgi:hypothetical protein
MISETSGQCKESAGAATAGTQGVNGDKITMPHINLPQGIPEILGPMAFSPRTAISLNELAEVLLRAEFLDAGRARDDCDLRLVAD